APLSPDKRLIPCNLRERRLLRHPDLYREFESLSLRHTVWVAEKSGCITARIVENCRNSAGLASKPHRRKWPVERHGLVSWRLSLEGTRAVRFQRLHQANAMRSQIDDPSTQTCFLRR